MQGACPSEAPERSLALHDPRKEKPLQRDQTVFEMVEEVLTRQARALADQTGQPFERALEIVANTEAGRQLRKLADGEHGHEQARDWQTSVLWERAEERLTHLVAAYAPPHPAVERHYSWLEGYLESLEGKEARAEFLARLEELASLNGRPGTDRARATLNRPALWATPGSMSSSPRARIGSRSP